MIFVRLDKHEKQTLFMVLGAVSVVYLASFEQNILFGPLQLYKLCPLLKSATEKLVAK